MVYFFAKKLFLVQAQKQIEQKNKTYMMKLLLNVPYNEKIALFISGNTYEVFASPLVAIPYPDMCRIFNN